MQKHMMSENPSSSLYDIRWDVQVSPQIPLATFSRRHHHPTAVDPAQSILIILNFSTECHFSSYRVTNVNSPPVLDYSDNSTWPDTRIQLNLRQYLCLGQAREIIARKFEDWPLPDAERQKLIEAALSWTQRALQSMTPSHRANNVLDLHFRVDVAQEHYCFDGTWMQSMMDEEIRMVPADEKTIVSLKESSNKVITASALGDCCAVCMEEFPEGCEAVRMSCCSQDFHGDCIDKWLRTSHYCPLCRFEMPTN